MWEGMEVFGLRSLLSGKDQASLSPRQREVRKGHREQTDKGRSGRQESHRGARQPWHRGLSVWVVVGVSLHSMPQKADSLAQ